jgi:hypothetical protein
MASESEPPAAPDAADPPAEAVAPEPAPESFERRALHEIIHLWIPLAIVVVSVCAAVVGWRASVSDESANHYEELSRQDLVQQQQLLVQDSDSVNTDIQTFGQFAQYSALAHSLLHDADVVGGAVGAQLRIQGAADLSIALTLGKQIQNVDYAFDPSNPSGNDNLRSDGTYAPGHAYNANQALATAENNDQALHGLAPQGLLDQADSQHDKGVDFTGIAALLIGVLVLLTLGAIVKGRQKLIFAASSIALGTLAVVLFAITQFA